MNELVPEEQKYDIMQLASKYDALAFDVAMQLEGKWAEETTDDAKQAMHGMSGREWARVVPSPAFKAKVAQLRKEISENGLSFRVKARVMAEELLQDVWAIARNPNVPANIRLQAQTRIVEWSGLVDRGGGAQGSQGSSIHIHLGTKEDDKGQVVEGEVISYGGEGTKTVIEVSR